MIPPSLIAAPIATRFTQLTAQPIRQMTLLLPPFLLTFAILLFALVNSKFAFDFHSATSVSSTAALLVIDWDCQSPYLIIGLVAYLYA